jgi:hypothetical protein
MLKRYVRMICFSLATTGAIFFAGNVYSNGAGTIVGQPQFDGPATAGTASVNNTATTANVPAEPSAQMSATSAGTAKTVPTSVNGPKVERDFFRGEGTAAK